MKGVFVTGTDTDVGKTWIGKKIIEELCLAGVAVSPRKPVEAGWLEDVFATDAGILATAAKKSHQLKEVCPNPLLHPVSPDFAAQLDNKKIHIKDLHQQCLQNISANEFLYVEGAGGFYSPLCSDGLNADLSALLDLPIILVVKNKLGCINHTLLTIEAIQKNRGNLLAVILNSSHKPTIKNNNAQTIQELIHCPLICIDHDEASKKPFKKIVQLILAP